MTVSEKYLNELDEFTNQYFRVDDHNIITKEKDRTNVDDNDEEEQGLDIEYEYDTGKYQAELDLDPDGIIVDQADPFVDNSTAQNALRNLIPMEGSYRDDLQKFLDNLNIEFFSAVEIMRAKGGSHFSPNSMCHNKNSLAPRSKWPLFARTIVALDSVRKDLDHPLSLVVAYRSKPYNECLIQQSKKNNGGKSGVAKFSQHLNFNAIDFRGNVGSPGKWGEAVKRYKEQHDPKVWFKTYKSFVHIDTRGNILSGALVT
jgi:hypothetical protein